MFWIWNLMWQYFNFIFISNTLKIIINIDFQSKPLQTSEEWAVLSHNSPVTESVVYFIYIVLSVNRHNSTVELHEIFLVWIYLILIKIDFEVKRYSKMFHYTKIT